MGVYEKLMGVQNALVVKKTRATSRYKYRNAEDILEAVKPILKQEKATLFLNDEVIQVGTRYYIKATATFVDVETGENICVSSLAREDEESKLMQTSQLTGSSISYARKYALGGLLCIDDGNDADKQDETMERASKKEAERQQKLRKIGAEMKRTGVEEQEILQQFAIDSIKRANEQTIDEILVWIQSVPRKV